MVEALPLLYQEVQVCRADPEKLQTLTPRVMKPRQLPRSAPFLLLYSRGFLSSLPGAGPRGGPAGGRARESEAE